MNRRVMWCVLMLGVLFLASGCAEKKVDGETTTVFYDLNAKLGIVAGIAAAVGLAVFRFLQKSILHAVIVACLAVGLGVTVAPMVFFDLVTLTPTNLKVQEYGMVADESIDLKFDDVSSARLTLTTTTGRRGRKNKNYYLEFSNAKGETKKTKLDVLIKPIMPEIVGFLGERGIEIVDVTGE